MRERLYQLNIPIILCCSAERKIAMIKNAEGKTEPIDIGLQPVCESDMPWAMTVSLMLPDVTKPGVPVPIKALLPALRQIIRLDAPLDEVTGARIGAWGRGRTPTLGEATGTEPPPGSSTSRRRKAQDTPPDDATIIAWAKALAVRFDAVTEMAAHHAIVQESDIERRLDWMRKNRLDLYREHIEPSLKASFARCTAPRDKAAPRNEQQQQPEPPPQEELPTRNGTGQRCASAGRPAARSGTRMTIAFQPRAGFNWMAVSWGGPDEQSAEDCSYCDAPLGTKTTLTTKFR